MDITQPDIAQRLELLQDARLILEGRTGFFDGKIEDLGNTATAEVHFHRFPIESLAFAHVARHEHVGEEMHFDLYESVALTALAPSALHIEREATGPVAADLGLWELGEQFAHRREDARVRGGIRAWRATDRALVDVDDLVEMLQAGDARMRPR